MLLQSDQPDENTNYNDLFDGMLTLNRPNAVQSVQIISDQMISPTNQNTASVSIEMFFFASCKTMGGNSITVSSFQSNVLNDITNLQLDNGQWARLVYNPTNTIENVYVPLTTEQVENIEPQMESLDDASWKIRMEKKLDKCLNFMMNFEKFMEHFGQNAKNENPSKFNLLFVSYTTVFISLLILKTLSRLHKLE